MNELPVLSDEDRMHAAVLAKLDRGVQRLQGAWRVVRAAAPTQHRDQQRDRSHVSDHARA
jgi:hypothetical protein